jgi:hypothetical protein
MEIVAFPARRRWSVAPGIPGLLLVCCLSCFGKIDSRYVAPEFENGPGQRPVLLLPPVLEPGQPPVQFSGLCHWQLSALQKARPAIQFRCVDLFPGAAEGYGNISVVSPEILETAAGLYGDAYLAFTEVRENRIVTTSHRETIQKEGDPFGRQVSVTTRRLYFRAAFAMYDLRTGTRVMQINFHYEKTRSDRPSSGGSCASELGRCIAQQCLTEPTERYFWNNYERFFFETIADAIPDG